MTLNTTELDYANLISDRNNVSYEIAVLKAVTFVHEKQFLYQIGKEIHVREKRLTALNSLLKILEKKRTESEQIDLSYSTFSDL